MVTEYTQGEGQSSPQRIQIDPTKIVIDPNANANLNVNSGQIMINPRYSGSLTGTYTSSHTHKNMGPTGPMGPVGPAGAPGGLTPEAEKKIKDLEAQLLQEKGYRYTMEYQIRSLEEAMQKLGRAAEEAQRELSRLGGIISILMADKDRRDRMEQLDDEQFRREIEGP